MTDTRNVPVEVLNATLQYLSTRPYNEVVHLIAALMQAAQQTQPAAAE